MPGVFPDYPAPVVRNVGTGREMVMMRWGMPPPPRAGGFPSRISATPLHQHWRGWLKPESRCLVPANSFAEYAPEPMCVKIHRHKLENAPVFIDTTFELRVPLVSGESYRSHRAAIVMNRDCETAADPELGSFLEQLLLLLRPYRQP